MISFRDFQINQTTVCHIITKSSLTLGLPPNDLRIMKIELRFIGQIKHHPCHLKILCQIDDVKLQVINRWVTDFASTHRTQNTLKIHKYPTPKQIISSRDPLLKKFPGENNHFRDDISTLDKRKKLILWND